MVVYHGTNVPIEQFDPALTVDGGLHFGTAKQAAIRAGVTGRNLVPVYLHIENPRRSRDAGGAWKAKIRSAKGAGFDGIVYTNRYEGIDAVTVDRALREGVDLDKLTDAEFRKYAPEARDSYIAFHPRQVKSAVGNAGAYRRADLDMTDRKSLATDALDWLARCGAIPKAKARA